MKPLTHQFHLAATLLGAIAGGYAATVSLMTLMSRLAHAAGVARADAVMLSIMLGCVIYCALLIWAFGVRRLSVLWGVLGGVVLFAGVLDRVLAPA